SLTPLRNSSKIFSGFAGSPSSHSSCGGPKVGTSREPVRPIHCVEFVSMHQNRLPTVCRIASTRSGPVPGGGASFGPKKFWQQRKSWHIAVIAIHASGRVRTACSLHTLCSRHLLPSRPENPHSSAYTSRILRPNTARPIGYSKSRTSNPENR